MFVEPGIKTGMPILVDNPAELGADRIVNGVAAFAKYGGPIIVVDFGTATTFDVITARGEYIGGVIAPGLGISADALFSRAAKLARVDVKRPAAPSARILSPIYRAACSTATSVWSMASSSACSQKFRPARRTAACQRQK